MADIPDTPALAKLPSVTRRTVVKGAAWTVPIIAAAVSVPLAAASVPLVCDVDNALGNGLATVTGISYPTPSPVPHGVGVMYTLAVDTIYSFVYEVTLRQLSLEGSYGDFGVKGGPWREVEIVDATSSDARIGFIPVPEGYETMYARASALTDLPEGTTFTVTVNVRMTAPAVDDLKWAMNAWWAGSYRNNRCEDPSMPAYVPNEDSGNYWDTGESIMDEETGTPAHVYHEDPLIMFQVI